MFPAWPDATRVRSPTGKVVWVTHKGSGSFKKEGVGVQLGEEQAELKVDIEQALTGTVHSHKPTLTM